MIITDEVLDGIYFDAVGEHLNEDRMIRCKAFIRGLFRALPHEGYIDSKNHLDTDCYLLDGAVLPLYIEPILENK